MHAAQQNNYLIFLTITALCWCIFYGYWLIKANHTKENVYVQGIFDRILARVWILAVFLLLYLPQLSAGWIGRRIVPQNYAIGIIADVICAAGVAFAVWARTILGGNWSGAVTIKKNHEIIMRGPYRYVRHPIYTGYLFATLGSALAVGEVRGAIALVMIFAGIIRKMGVEERLLSKNFPDTYPEYKRRVKRLIPFVM
jgi:protein-S-isoprenylcysteine O-methyltransferase